MQTRKQLIGRMVAQTHRRMAYRWLDRVMDEAEEAKRMLLLRSALWLARITFSVLIVMGLGAPIRAAQGVAPQVGAVWYFSMIAILVVTFALWSNVLEEACEL